MWHIYTMVSVQFSPSVVSNSLWPHELQHARRPVQHQLPEFTQTHIHQVGDSIQPSTGPSYWVNRQINRHFHRKIHAFSGWVPSTLSETSIMPADNSAVTEGSLCYMAPVSWLFSERLCMCLPFWKVALALFITICFCLFARKVFSTCVTSIISW